MKVTDYIVDFIINNGIKDIFGYPGGMVTNLIESIRRKNILLHNHLLYNEQSVAFAACAYSELTKLPAICYATSGPGATNLITGIANAYFDSLPVIFITGQVNRNESSRNMNIKQRGFQETDIVSMVSKITKMAFYCDKETEIPSILEKAFLTAMSGRKGPVLLDIPMDVQKAEIDYVTSNKVNLIANHFDVSIPNLSKYKRPVILLGNAVKLNLDIDKVRKLLRKINLPVITSMIAFDILPKHDVLNFGFIGAYGDRYSNFIMAKADLIISIGSRLDIRQVGINRKLFAPQAKVLRFDIDESELEYKIRNDDIAIKCDCGDALEIISNAVFDDVRNWLDVCKEIKSKLINVDEKNKPQTIFEYLSKIIPSDSIISTDVGQNQVWVAQYFENRDNFVLFSGNLGSMGYSLPASIGAAYAFPNRTIISFNGDGGLQMNIQELETIFRDNLNVKIFVFNNHALGMIRHFQEMYFDSQYLATTEHDGFSVPSFVKIAQAYGIKSKLIKNYSDLMKISLLSYGPELIEIDMPFDTYVVPKLRFGSPNQDQEPLLDRALYNYLMKL